MQVAFGDANALTQAFILTPAQFEVHDRNAQERRAPSGPNLARPCRDAKRISFCFVQSRNVIENTRMWAHDSPLHGAPMVITKSFPQTISLIIKALNEMPRFCTDPQVIEKKEINFSPRWSREKKGGLNLEVSLQKLLKTRVEKMSTFGPEQKLLKTQQVKVFLKLYT